MFALVFASLIATCFASLPVLEFKDGGCPNFHPSANFQPSQIEGKYYVVANTEAGPPQDNCCKCGEIVYHAQNDNKIDSTRTVYTFSGTPKQTKGQYILVEQGKFNYQYLDNGDFKDTHMTVTFHQQDDYLIVYGCIPKDGKHADVALILNRSRNTQITPAIKNLLAPTKLDTFLDVNQENCS